MKTQIKTLLFAGTLAAFCSCGIDGNEPPHLVQELDGPKIEEVDIDPRLKDFMVKNGIITSKIKSHEGRYIVDECIVITEEKLSEWDSSQKGANLQTRTQANVSVPVGEIKTITYRIASNIPSSTATLINQVIQNYNSIRNFNLNFQPTTSTNQQLLFLGVTDSPPYYVPTGKADWPTNGNIGSFVELDINDFNSTSITNGIKLFVIAHEIGHTIGFRHTDWLEQEEGNYGYDDGIYKFIGGTLIPATFHSDPISIYNSTGYYQDRYLPTPEFSDFPYTDLLAIRYMYSKDNSEKPFYSYVSTGSGWANWTTDWLTYGYGTPQYGFWGITGYIYSSSKTGTVPLYKYTHVTGTPYMSTTSNLDVSYPSFTNNGPLGNVYTTSGQSRVPVYEWYNPNVGYFFTTNAVDNYVQGPGWIGGGIAFYAMSLGTL